MRRHPPASERAFAPGRRSPAADHLAPLMVLHHVQVSEDDVGPVQGGGDRRQRACVVEAVVGVQEAHGLAAERQKALVHRVIDAAVLSGRQDQVLAGEGVNDLQGVVAGAAIDDQDLLVGMILEEERLQRVADRRRRIAAHSDDRELHLTWGVVGRACYRTPGDSGPSRSGCRAAGFGPGPRALTDAPRSEITMKINQLVLLSKQPSPVNRPPRGTPARCPKGSCR